MFVKIFTFVRVVCVEFLILLRVRECNAKVDVGVVRTVLAHPAGKFLIVPVEPYAKAVGCHLYLSQNS